MNKKGITLVEIIISIVLISIVLIFLFSLLITVKDINDESEVNSTYLINKSLILKNIESDLDKASSVKLEECTAKSGSSYKITELYSNYGETSDTGEPYFPQQSGGGNDPNFTGEKCLKFVYGTNDYAYLGIYYYKSKESYVISYIHDDVKATRLLPDFEKSVYNINSLKDSPLTGYKTWTYNGSNSIPYNELNGFYVINIPIIGSDGKDYGINISYYK